MELIKKGKKSKGLKYFNLQEPGFGVNIKCSSKDFRFIQTFHNVNVLEWIDEGKKVYMSSNHHDSYTNPYNMNRHDLVEISEAKEIHKGMINIERK